VNAASLPQTLKNLIEGLHPDLRPFLRPSLLGKVVAVDDDNYRVDVVVGGDEETGEEGLALPEIPVASLFAQDGYGICALPEFDAEVTVSFHDGNVTRPYVEAPIFHTNQAPIDFKTGTVSVVGKQGQKIILKPDDNEIAINCETLSIIRDSKGVEKTKGDFEHVIDGKRTISTARCAESCWTGFWSGPTAAQCRRQRVHPLAQWRASPSRNPWYSRPGSRAGRAQAC